LAGAAGLIFGAVFGQLAGFLIFLVVHIKANSQKWSWLNFAEMRRLGKVYSLFPRYNMWQGLVNNLSGALPVFIFSSYFSLAIAGIYTFGYMLIYRPVNLVAGAFYQVLYQRFSEKLNKGQSFLSELMLFLRQAIMWLLIPFVVFGIFAPEIFGFIFEKAEAGRYAQLMLPWIFMVSLTMPLSFIPDLYKKQRTALFIDTIRLVGRGIALAIGVKMESVYLGLALFSGVSALMILYSLAWYIRLVKRNQISDDE
jgi:O-antigen/teichoic acid export membrane protein